MNPSDVYKKIYNAKNEFSKSFDDWLRCFLFFLPAELLQTNIERFGECMETKEGYLKYKALGSYLHKYVSTNYIFYYKKDDTPDKMTNALKLCLDSEQWVMFFNMDFFNLKTPSIVLYSFVEALNLACIDAKLDFEEIYKKFVHLYFTINDFDYIIREGPAKSRFSEYYRVKTKESFVENPNKTLVISDKFINSIDDSKKEKIKKILFRETPLVEEDYAELIKILDIGEKKGKMIWTDDKFSVYRSNSGKYLYLVNEDDGKVWKVYDVKTNIKNIISDYEEINT